MIQRGVKQVACAFCHAVNAVPDTDGVASQPPSSSSSSGGDKVRERVHAMCCVRLQ